MTIVLVSHSMILAKATKKYLHEMIPNLEDEKVKFIGGTFDGGIGTDSEAILKAVESSKDNDVLIICDLGSAILSSQVVQEMSNKNITIANGSFIEGAFSAAVLIASDAPNDLIISSANELTKKY